MKAALSVKPKTPAEAVLPYLPLCSLILVMTVEPGFGGQSFMEDMMPKVRTIRGWIETDGLDCELEVDGGVNEKTAKNLHRRRRERFSRRQRLFQSPR